MKTTLTISVFLNVILLALFLGFHPQPSRVIPAPRRVIPLPPPPPAPVRTEAMGEPFHWNQLLSSNDYPVFVANLRAAGCPESTIADIVQGDLARAYAMMRARLGVNATDAGPWSRQAQAQMAAYFLGQSPLAAVMAQNSSPDNPPDGTQTPLVLQNVDLSTLKLDDSQTQALASIRETFWNSVGGANQNTIDPSYAARWQKAQSQADNMLLAMLGEQAFAQYQIEAYQLALQNQGTTVGN